MSTCYYEYRLREIELILASGIGEKHPEVKEELNKERIRILKELDTMEVIVL